MTDRTPGALVDVRTVAGNTLVAQRDVIADLEAALARTGSLYHWAAEHPQSRALRGRAPVYVAELPTSGQTVVVRHVWHGGMFAPITGDRWFNAQRPAREMARSDLLCGFRIPTTRVLGFASYKAGPFMVRLDVVTQYLPDSFDLGAVLTELAPGISVAEAMSATVRLVRQLGAHRLVHPDLNVKNILLRREQDALVAHVIDIDVMRWRPDWPIARVHRANVSRLGRSLHKWTRHEGARMSAAENGTIIRKMLDETPEPAERTFTVFP